MRGIPRYQLLLGIERTHGQPKRKARVFQLEHLESIMQTLSLKA